MIARRSRLKPPSPLWGPPPPAGEEKRVSLPPLGGVRPNAGKGARLERSAFCLLTLSAAPPALAHHAFAAEFDAHAPVLLRGKVTKVEWINPHTWIHMTADTAGGAPKEWMVEGGTPNTLLRVGINRDSLKPGADIIVHGYQSKDKLCTPACKANGRDVTLANGQKLFMGSSGTGAPRDGADPNEPAH